VSIQDGNDELALSLRITANSKGKLESNNLSFNFLDKKRQGMGSQGLKIKKIWTRRYENIVKTQVAAETQNLFLGSSKKVGFIQEGTITMLLWPDLSSSCMGLSIFRSKSCRTFARPQQSYALGLSVLTRIWR